MLQGFRTPAASATTSEPQAGNGPPGAPVTASMSDGFGRNQGGTVEYICIPPLIEFRGWVFFIPSPLITHLIGGYDYGKREPVHL